MMLEAVSGPQSLSTRFWAATFIASCMFLSLPVQAHTEDQTLDVESLVQARRWDDAARSIFMESRQVDPIGWDTVVNQAQAGFIDEAIVIAKTIYPTSRSGLLLKILQSAPALSVGKQQEIIQLALDNARGITGPEQQFVADAFTAMSLLEVGRGLDLTAQAVYREALEAAEKGLGQQSNSGYRRVTDELVKADDRLLREWMVAPLVERVRKTPDPFDEALTYRDLAKLTYRLGNPAEAKRLIDLGLSVADAMPLNNLRMIAVRGIAEFAIRIRDASLMDRFRSDFQLSPEYAAYEAERGNHDRALALISVIPNTLYVGHKRQTQIRIISEALQRKDLATAIYYTERLSECPYSVELKAWTQIAEAQADAGDMVAAKRSYEKAEALLKTKEESEYFDFEILTILALGQSLCRHGYRDHGDKIVASTSQYVELISTRRTKDRVLVRAAIAPALQRIGMQAEATRQVLTAYREAHAYPTDDSTSSKLTKAEMLSAVGLAVYRLNDNSP